MRTCGRTHTSSQQSRVEAAVVVVVALLLLELAGLNLSVAARIEGRWIKSVATLWKHQDVVVGSMKRNFEQLFTVSKTYGRSIKAP